MTPKPQIAAATLSRCESATKPTKQSAAPANMARLAVSNPLSRNHPAGKATPAWKKTQTLRIQKVLLCVQPWASERVSSAEP